MTHWNIYIARSRIVGEKYEAKRTIIAIYFLFSTENMRIVSCPMVCRSAPLPPTSMCAPHE